MFSKTYYGWWVLIGLSMLYFASNGYGYLSIPVFYPSLTDFLHQPKGIIPQTASIMTFIIALLSPLLGYFLDKYNPKIILFLGIFLLLAMQYFFTKISSLTDFKLFNIGYAIALCLGGFTSSVFILNKWFDKNRGIALGIFLNASSLGAFFFSPMIGSQLKTGLAWQTVATNILYFSTFLLIIPLFFIKTNKKWQKNKNIDKSEETISVDISLKDAVKTSTFWLLLLATGGLWFCINGLLFHKDSFLSDINLDPKERGNFSQLFFLCSIIGKLFFGFMSDKVDKKSSMLFAILTLLVGTILLKLSQNNTILLPYLAIVYGIGYSGSFTMIQLLIAEFYSGKNYGSILGFFIMADTLCGALGTFLLGSFRKTSGNYDSGFTILIIICFFALIATFLTKKSINNLKNG